MDEHLTHAVTVVVVDGYTWAINRELLEVRPAVSVKLSVEVRKKAALKKGVFRKVNAADDMARLELRSELAKHERQKYGCP